MYQATVTQRKITIPTASGQKELTVEYERRSRQVFRAELASPPNSRFMTACPLMPHSRGVIIDIGDGDTLLFDVSREVFYHTNTSGRLESFRPLKGDSVTPGDVNLDRLLENLLD